ncbi:MAG: hypothetical protein JXA41_10565, partial [Deltaproteobacteria bacterium]|nr:hypothetical protein [Deltaproteobacteria bacterium]
MNISRILKHGMYIAMAIIVMAIMPSLTSAGVTFKDGDKYVKLGGRIHLQYKTEDPDTGSSSDKSTDDLFFRRFRPEIEGSIHKDWMGKFQWDMGKAENDNELSIVDAYLRYKGLDFMTVTFFNATFPFSREVMTSSNKKQLVEASFVGNHDYGTPDHNLGMHLNGHFGKDKNITWG